MKEPDDIRELVRELVAQLAMEKETLAGRLDVSYASLYAWCTGRRTAGPRMLLRMADLAQGQARTLEELAGRLRLAGDASRMGGGGGARGGGAPSFASRPDLRRGLSAEDPLAAPPGRLRIDGPEGLR